VLPTAAGLVVLKDGLPLWTTREFGEESSGKTRPGVARRKGRKAIGDVAEGETGLNHGAQQKLTLEVS
jgi:hypothetical protein